MKERQGVPGSGGTLLRIWASVLSTLSAPPRAVAQPVTAVISDIAANRAIIRRLSGNPKRRFLAPLESILVTRLLQLPAGSPPVRNKTPFAPDNSDHVPPASIG